MTQYTEASMIQGAKRQYRACFRAMAARPCNWCIVKDNETLSGVILVEKWASENREILVENVQAMAEQTMVNALSQAVRKHGATV